MDELEISGKRYISTRRAAKEHKYSSDYIGQLIRGKKVIGHKVGRSWYVDEDSLADYLGKEGKEKGSGSKKTSAPVTALDTISSPEQSVEEDVVIEEKSSISRAAISNEAMHTEKEVKTSSRVKHLHLGSVRRVETEEERAYRIPVNIKEKKGLVYLKDDEPLFPIVEKKKGRTRAETSMPVPQRPQEAEGAQAEAVFYEEELVEKISPRKASYGKKVLTLLLVGAFVTGSVMGLSTIVGSKLIQTEGEGMQIQFSRY